MSKRGLYAVRISGLADGDHGFSFMLDRKFFASLEQAEVETGQVKADVILEKKHGLISLHFILKGVVEVVCDRCLDPFMAEVDTKQTIFVKLGDTPGEIEDDVIMIHREDHEIDVRQLMYEFVILALPYKRIHPVDEKDVSTCNPEMIRRLNDHRGIREEEEKRDPRWDALKDL
ncbi:MAG: DUF177 domain-containing protein [Bacteroidota bacterium]